MLLRVFVSGDQFKGKKLFLKYFELFSFMNCIGMYVESKILKYCYR